MKVCGPLPEVMMPYAERMFTWFPEVLVALGHPTLQELFVLPPHPGVQMTLEETSAYKLVQVKLRRCSKRRMIFSEVRDGESSPFSKSRANAPAHAAARASAAVRSGELKEEPHFLQKSGRSHVGANHPSSREGDVATGRGPAAGALRAASDRSAHADSQTNVSPSAGPSQGLVEAAGGGKCTSSVVAATPTVHESSPSRVTASDRSNGYPHQDNGAREVLEDAPASTTPASTTPAAPAPRTPEDSVAAGSASRSGLPNNVSTSVEGKAPQQHASGDLSEPLRGSAKKFTSAPATVGDEVGALQRRSEPALVPAAASSSSEVKSRCRAETETLISAAAPARLKSGTMVMSRGDADPHSPKLSSPGSHNPWNAPLPFLKPLDSPKTNSSKDEQPRRPSIGTISKHVTPEPSLLLPLPEDADLPRVSETAILVDLPKQGVEEGDVSTLAIEQPRRDGLPPLPPMAETALAAPPCSESVASPVPARGADCEKPPLPPDGLRTPVVEPSGSMPAAAPLTPGSMASEIGSSSGDTPSKTADPQAVPASPGGTGRLSSVPLRSRRGLELQMPTHVRTFKKEKNTLAKDPGRFSSGNACDGLGDCTKQVCPPAIISQSLLNAKGIKMPGAFPHHRTVFFFDWDDTLCPTTWIRDTLKCEMADTLAWAMSPKEYEEDWRYSIPSWFGQPLPDIPQIRDKIWALQRSVIDVIKTAQSLGVVCIVTNACEGWVEKTTKKWLPHLTEYVFGHGSRPAIQVLYGQLEYKATRQNHLDESLDFVDGLHELKLWKKSAMQAALEHVDDLYRVGPRCSDRTPSDSSSFQSLPQSLTMGRHSLVCRQSSTVSQGSACSGLSVNPSASTGRNSTTSGDLNQVPWVTNGSRSNDLVNILSIGDSEAEMQGAELAASVYRDALRQPPGSLKRAQSAPAALRLPGRPWVKKVKLWDGPSLDQIVEQLDFLTASLPQVVAARSHLRLEPEHLRTWASPPPGTGEEEETRVQRLLRTQSI